MALPDPNSNAETIEKVYAGYRQELLGFFRKLARKKDRVEDLVQAVYLGLQRCRTLPSVDKPKQFLYRIAWNVLRSDKPQHRPRAQVDGGSQFQRMGRHILHQ